LEIKEFCRKQDIVRKLYAAVENLELSDLSFLEGLQEGKAIVKVVFDGEAVRFEKPSDGEAFKTKATVPKAEVFAPKPLIEINNEKTVTLEMPSREPKKKSRFK